MPDKIRNNIVDTAVKAGSFSTLLAAVKAASLVETLKHPNLLLQKLFKVFYYFLKLGNNSQVLKPGCNIRRLPK